MAISMVEKETVRHFRPCMLPRNELTQSSLFSCTVCQALCLVAFGPITRPFSSRRLVRRETASAKTFQITWEQKPHPISFSMPIILSIGIHGERRLFQGKIRRKMIFLSIGYSTCHWCHVMAHESLKMSVLPR